MSFTTSQWISSIVLVASIVFYFAARTGQQQNAFLYVFGVALVVLIVGKFNHNFRYALHEPKRLWIRTPLWKLAKKKRCIKLSLIFYHSFIVYAFKSYKSSKTLINIWFTPKPSDKMLFWMDQWFRYLNLYNLLKKQKIRKKITFWCDGRCKE